MASPLSASPVPSVSRIACIANGNVWMVATVFSLPSRRAFTSAPALAPLLLCDAAGRYPLCGRRVAVVPLPTAHLPANNRIPSDLTGQGYGSVSNLCRRPRVAMQWSGHCRTDQRSRWGIARQSPSTAQPTPPSTSTPPNTKVTNHFWFVTFVLSVRRTAHCGRRGT